MTNAGETVTGSIRAATVERLFNDIAESRLRSLAAILIVAFVAFLPGFSSIAPLDRAEPTYAIQTRSLLKAADTSVGPQPNSVRFLQPAGMNWLQLASVSLFGDGAESKIWVYRLPSLIAAISLPFLVLWMALAFGRPRAAFVTALLLISTPLVVSEARLAKSDAVLLAAIILAQGGLARIWRGKVDGPDYRNAFLFWTGLGIGILAKGFIAPVVLGSTIAVLTASGKSHSWLRRLAPVPGVLWLTLLLVPSFVASGLVAGRIAGDEVGLSSIAVQDTFDAPPGIYAVLFYPLFGPAAVFIALAIPRVVEQIRRPVFLFAVAWVAPFWLLCELWPVKLPYYVLPTFPALALVGGTALDEGWLRITGWISTYFSLNLLLWPIFVAGGATILFFESEGHLPYTALPFFVIAVAAGAGAFLWFFRGRSVIASATLSILSALFLYVGILGGVFPGATALQASGRLVAEGKEALACAEPEIVSTGFFEPSLVFLGGDDIRLVSAETAAEFLAEGGCRVAFVEGRRQSIFNQRAEDIGLDLDVRREIRGFNVGNRKLVKVRIFAVEGSPP
jgi:4-amino-4-deoxy-L-arabinose transferase-like glycosyltransferase